MAKFPTIEEFVQQVKERVLAECLIDGEPLGELIDSGDLVHVCRCKDCMHRDEETANCTRFRKDWYVQSNSFCSWAEPKEEKR